MKDLKPDHPDPDRLRAYALGRIDPAEMASIERHVAACDACCQALKDQPDDALVALLRQREAGPDRPQGGAGAVPGDGASGSTLGLNIPSSFSTAADAAADAAPGAAPRAVSSTPELPPDLVDHPRYRVVELLGAGGMGTVYKAEHRLMERAVALKVIRHDLVDRSASVDRFLREVKMAARLSHPNIVIAFDAEQVGRTHVLVMEYVEGTDLAHLVRERGPLPVAEACDYVRQAANGLQYANEHGMVHRDIKPQNLMRTPRGQVKILDFGLARFASEAGAPGGLTAEGMVLGSADYIAPEQVDDARSADIRADIYSLGCTLYHLLAGLPPFPEGSLLQKLNAHSQHTPKPLAALREDLPPGLDRVLERMMTKDRARRYQTPAEVAQALSPFVETAPTVAIVAGPESSGGVDAESPAPTAAAIEKPSGADESGSTDLGVPAPVEPGRSRRSWRPIAAAVALLLLCGLLAWQVIVRIKDKDGIVTEIPVRSGSVLEIEIDGHVLDGVQGEGPRPRPGPGPAKVPAVAPSVATGEPLSPLALVSRPQRIDGMRGWTIVWRDYFGGFNWCEATPSYSPDHRWLAVNGMDGVVRLYDPGTGRLARALVGHAGPVLMAAWSPDGKTLASASADRTVQLWDAETGRRLRILRGHEADVYCVAWSPDGKAIASCCDKPDFAVRLWDPATGRLLGTLRGHQRAVMCLAWSPDGKWLASGGATDDPIRIWDVVSGQTRHLLKGHTDWVYFVTWSPDGNKLVSGGPDGTIRIWDTAQGRLLHTEPTESGWAYGAAWSPDGNELAVGCGDALLFLDLEGPRRLRRFEGHLPLVAWSPDGKQMAVTDGSKLMNLDPFTGQVLRTIESLPLPDGGAAFAWSPDGKWFATGSNDGDSHPVRIWEVGSGKLRSAFNNEAGVLDMAWSPDGRTLAVPTPTEGSIRLWDTETEKLVDKFPEPGAFQLCWSSDSKSLFSQGNEVRLWDTDARQVVRTFEGSAGFRSRLALSADGTKIAASADDPSVQVWDVSSGETLHRLQVPSPNAINGLDWSPDGTRLALGLDSPGEAIRIYDLSSGRLALAPFDAAQVCRLAWSPDGRRIASANRQGLVQLWDAASGELLADLRGQLIDSWVMGWSPAGKLLGSRDDHSLRIWDGETGRQEGVILLRRDNQWLAVGSRGHFRGSPRIERHLAYVVETDAGQETLSAEEFTRKYGWKNDPERVRLNGQ